MKHQESEPAVTQSALQDGHLNAVILGQLTRIQNSHAFSTSPRAKQFLSHVVEHAVEGHTELLKERSIGVDLFRRAPTYMTGEDPIVRVHAAEVRKRLALYYAEEERTPEVRIEIPVGSYVPKFHWGLPEPSTSPPDEIATIPQNVLRPKRSVRGAAVAAIVLAVLGIGVAGVVKHRAPQRSNLDEFWAPVFATTEPVLICLSSPVLYHPVSSLYVKSSQAHPGIYDTQVERAVTALELDPNTPLEWKEIEPLADIYVAKADTYTATDLTDHFARIHKTSQVRIGRDFTYEDLRHSPAVLIGAFNNPWSIRMASELPIYFREEGIISTIVERGGQGRVWRTGDDNRGIEDFALVARLLNSKTGQFLVILGGIGRVGMQAAGNFVSSRESFDAAIRLAPAGWQDKNLEMVIESDVIDGSASPPRVIAVKTW